MQKQRKSFFWLNVICRILFVAIFCQTVLAAKIGIAASAGETCIAGAISCDSTSCTTLTCSSSFSTGICQITSVNINNCTANQCGNGICEPSSPNTPGGEDSTTCPVDCTSNDNTTFTATSCRASSLSCSTTADGCCPGLTICPNDPDCIGSSTTIDTSCYPLEGSGGGNGQASGCGSAPLVNCTSSMISPSILETLRPFTVAQWLGTFLIPGTIYTFRRLKRNRK